MKTGTLAKLLPFLILQTVVQADEHGIAIHNLKAESGKIYIADVGGFRTGALQFVDRDYKFDYVPAFLQGATHIRTAGDDKLIDQTQPCLTFEVDVPVSVYIVYGDKLRIPPEWLKDFENTRWKVTRKDSNTTTLKGIFTLFRKDFAPGKVVINGNLSPAMAADPEFKKMKGGTFCMYSVIVAAKSANNDIPPMSAKSSP